MVAGIAELSWEWRCLPFDEISTPLLYEVLRPRQQVFVIEQRSFFNDIDGNDPDCLHCLAITNGEIVGYARIVPPQSPDTPVSIGRVVTKAAARGSGLGRRLMAETLTETEQRFPNRTITIEAQVYLQKFYESFGFTVDGEPYDEDDVLHIHMTRVGFQSR